MKCYRCNRTIPRDARFCPYCGNSLEENSNMIHYPTDDSINVKYGRTREELDELHLERGIYIHALKLQNQFRNLATNKDRKGFWSKSWDRDFKVELFNNKYKWIKGKVKDNNDGTLTIKMGGLLFPSYHTFSWEEISNIS